MCNACFIKLLDMDRLLDYLERTLGLQAVINPATQSASDGLPLYIRVHYTLYIARINGIELVLAALHENSLSVKQIVQHVGIIKNALQLSVVLVLPHVPAFKRKRLIEKRVNLIVPGKQLYMPDLLIDLRESTSSIQQKKESLLPSAQCLLIYHLIHSDKNWRLEEQSFKAIAQKFGYSPMANSHAIANLKSCELAEVVGTKEKFIRFRHRRRELWQIALDCNLMVNPVIKTVYVNEKPQNLLLLSSNASALPAYTELNPVEQQFFAVEKSVFYALQKSGLLVEPNDQEGQYALEVWKYNPASLVGDLPGSQRVIDPLSLYLSMMESADERVQIALEKIVQKYVWLGD